MSRNGPSALADRRLERFIEFWMALPKTGGCALRKSIDLADCRSFAPYLLVVDVLGPELDFRARLAGTAVVERFGFELPGRRMSEMAEIREVARLIGDCAFAVDNRMPSLSFGAEPGDGGARPAYRRMMCPVAGNGDRVDMLIGVQIAEPSA